MPSLLSRFRKRAVSNPPPQSAAYTNTSHPTIIETTQTSNVTFAVHNPDPTPRKIHPDVNSLLESYAEEEDRREPTGLRPSSRRHSVDGSNPRDTHARIVSRPIPQEPVLEIDESESFNAQQSDDKSRTRSPSPANGSHAPKGPLFNRLSQFVTVREWSTFGRHTEHSPPKISESDDPSSSFPDFRAASIVRRSSSKRVRHLSRNSSARSNASDPQSPHTSRPSTQSHGDTSTSPANAVSSQRNASQGDTSSFRRTPNTSARTSVIPSQSARDVGFDSPGTFGQPTPPHSKGSQSGPSPGSVWGAEIYPPPLPPLDHPAFSMSVSSRIKGTVHGDIVLRPSSLKTLSGIAKQETRRRSMTLEGLPFRAHSRQDQPFVPSRNAFATLPISLGKYARSRTNSNPFPPRPRKGSDTGNSATSSTPNRRSSLRRRSADWSSQQAVIGVNESKDLSWPAEVSREMLRLSLGERVAGLESVAPARVRRGARARSSSDGVTSKSRHNVQSRGETTLVPNFPNLVQRTHPLPCSPPEESIHLGSPFLLQEIFDTQSDDPNHDHFTAAEEGNHHMGSEEPNPNKISPPSTISRKDIVKDHDSSTNGPSQSSPAANPISTSSDAGPSSPIAPDFSFTAPTPGTSPKRSISDPSSMALPIPKSSRNRPASAGTKGKRKAESELDKDTHDSRKDADRAKITLLPERRVNRASGESSSSKAPSSYARKRPKVSGSTPVNTPIQSRPGSALKRGDPGSLSSRTSIETRASRIPATRNLYRATSKVASSRSITEKDRDVRPSQSRRSMSISQVSIPISALVSPHAPSIGHSTKYHMRDPRKPKKISNTGWALRFKSKANEEHGSPIHAWLFFGGFVIFFLWWIASFLKVPKTRSLGGSDVEKAIIVDDPQVEHDAKAWRYRCRVMSVVSFFTYIPFIVLVAVFVRR